MAAEVIMPKLGLTMTEGTVLNWFKKEGDTIKAGEPLFEVETDKVALEVNATASGILLKILAEPGDTVPLSQVIAFIGEPGELAGADQTPASKEEQTIPSSIGPGAGGASAQSQAGGDERLKVSGLARRMAQEHQVDLVRVAGTGPQGRIMEADIQRVIAAREPVTVPVEVPRKKISGLAKRLAREQGVDFSTLQGSGPQGRIVEADIRRAVEARKVVSSARPAIPANAEAPYELHPLNSVRKRAALRMSESFQTAPHFYLGMELNAGKLVTLRENLLAYVEARDGVKLTYTDFLLRALAAALPGHPLLNASFDRDQVRVYSQVHLGVAIATGQGLVVGVIHQAERLRLEGIARQRAALSDKARAGKLAPDDVTGGTFTLTNLGMYAIDDMIPILNPPQSAILGAGAIVERPVGENGQVVLRPTLRLTLSVDHRVADGADAAQFMKDLRELLEEPGKLV